MRSDFINKRDTQRKRNATATQNSVDREVIVIPEFDTFYYHATQGVNSGGDDRWNDSPGGFPQIGSNGPETMPQVPIALFNPWNDANDNQDGGSSITPIKPNRTPTRAAFAFNLSALPANAQIISANLNLTVASKRYWDMTGVTV